MSRIQNYVPNQFSQINLDDGSKVLISLADSEIKVFLLGFFGFPKETLYTFNSPAVDRISLVWNGDVVEFVLSQLLTISTVEEAVEKCTWIEEDFLKTFSPSS